MSDTVLRTEDLTKQFGSFVAVDHVDLTIERGSIKGLIGPNGAGKTTLQNLITGKYETTEGSVYLDGEDITNLSPYKRARRGLIRKFQVTRVYEEETIEENMRLALRGRSASTFELLRIRQDTDIDERINQLLDIANLSDKRKTKAGELSHGEKQWLEIIMAVGADPEFLLLDEPTSGMSPQETSDTIDFISDIMNTQDMSLLVVEHDMDFIRNITNDVTVLHEGEVLAEGSVDEVSANDRVQEVYLGRE